MNATASSPPWQSTCASVPLPSKRAVRFLATSGKPALRSSRQAVRRAKPSSAAAGVLIVAPHRIALPVTIASQYLRMKPSRCAPLQTGDGIGPFNHFYRSAATHAPEYHLAD